jgi:hypothetical protein
VISARCELRRDPVVLDVKKPAAMRAFFMIVVSVQARDDACFTVRKMSEDGNESEETHAKRYDV